MEAPKHPSLQIERKCVFVGLFMNRMNEESVQTMDDRLMSRKADRLIDVLDSDCVGNETPSSCLI